MTKRSEEWETPSGFYRPLQREFQFTLDAAASAKNAKCRRYFDKRRNGLTQAWGGQRVWVNPPYGDMEAWAKKAVQATSDPARETLVVMLTHARVDTRWWHRWVVPFADEVRFVQGRPRFIRFDGFIGSPTKPYCLVIWRSTRPRRPFIKVPRISQKEER